ncbi:unnamed protein product [Cuscuta europaea]|uniref:adenine phosphoribosyltransferase n=1 Tax=Cuscuta europaea TaxID=41803 RepID=A0A9P0YWH1_CUSEU|nr:unnamed protein product [Cuscuta europaea]
MASTARQSALIFSRGNFGEKVRRYFQDGNLVRINLHYASAASAATATRRRRPAQPIRASTSAANGSRSDPGTNPLFDAARPTEMASHNSVTIDPRIPAISSTIRVIPDFPKPGILFHDITTLLLDPKAFKDTIDLFVERYKDKNINVVAGVEARGFIFGPPIALAIGAKFVPMRKPKKLPGEVISQEYTLEYGTDVMEMHVGAVHEGERVLIIDDLIATGGTLVAAIKLIERVGGILVECACVIELPELKGRERLGDKPLFVLVS